jgi:hypothetical protein
MSDTVALLFGVHAHQPAGNFPKVVREAHEKCYRPFLDVLERHPEFPFAIHLSGWLMEFLFREFPSDMAKLRAMVGRGQAELFGGGDTEPVLAAIPEQDRRDQILALNRRIRRHFGVWPRGAWLTERVWEATVVPALAESRIEYVTVDDYHFLCAGQPQDRLDGHFSTEENCCRLDVLPISEALRYKFPFAPVPDAVGFLENMKPGGAAIYFDDIEKFGIWPETHEWVFGRRWLEDFIESVTRSPRIEALRYADYHGAHQSRGVVYLPTVSYIEMSEWTLPPQSAERFSKLVERARHEGTFGQDKVYLRGGHWRNFFSRYPESNWMHKRMELASLRFHSLPHEKQTGRMRSDLHLAQANDAYWHGLFGGIYLPHLRRQVYSAIARLEAAVDVVAARPSVERIDLDFDDLPEVFLWCPELLAVVKPHAGASICELTHYGLAHNFADTLTRREEHYFDKIRAQTASSAPSDGGVASIHDRVGYRTRVTPSDLGVDTYARAMFLDFWKSGGGTATFIEYEPLPTRGAACANFAGRTGDVAWRKRVKVASRGLTVTYDVSAQAGASGILTVELNVAMPSCDGPGGAYVVSGEKRARFDERLEVARCSSLRLADSELGGSLILAASTPAEIVAEPLYTVSQSEAGFEKIMQAATIRASWPIELTAGAAQRLVVRLIIAA